MVGNVVWDADGKHRVEDRPYAAQVGLDAGVAGIADRDRGYLTVALQIERSARTAARTAAMQRHDVGCIHSGTLREGRTSAECLARASRKDSRLKRPRETP